jgi:hypothetical protein
MADAIELTEHNDQRENETAGSGSGSLAIQEVNRSYVRLRRAPRDVGYSGKRRSSEKDMIFSR